MSTRNAVTVQTIKTVSVTLPCKDGDTDIPEDFPLREYNRWTAVIDVVTGRIHDWPLGKSGEIYMKIVDRGTYDLLDESKQQVAVLFGKFVPHGLIPGDYGDYIDLKIDETGKITNWPSTPDFSDFGLSTRML